MGLFNLLKKHNNNEVNEEKVQWFFTSEALSIFNSCAKYRSEMQKIITSDRLRFSTIFATSLPKGYPHRNDNFLSTFFADYLRELNTITPGGIVYFAAEFALDHREDIPFPLCLEAEFNPIINYAIKINRYRKKGGSNFEFSHGINNICAYIYYAPHYNHDISNETWMFDESLYFNEKGKLREDEEIDSLMIQKTQYPEFLSEIIKTFSIY